MKNLYFYITLSLLFACSSGTETQPGPQTSAGEENASQLVFTENEFNSGGLSLVNPAMWDFGEVIRANGYMDVPPEGRASVSAFYGGYVKDISLIPGEEVRKGEVLMTLENPEYLEMQQQYLSVLKRMNYLRDDYERQKTLLDENISSRKSYLKSEAEYNTATAELEGLREKLMMLGINLEKVEAGKFTSTILLRAPIAGYITEVQATRGHFLPPAEAAVTIVNTNHLHVEIQVFEKDLPKIKIGQQIRMRLPPDIQVQGILSDLQLMG
ncbi:MAG: efflux RND transporter periplasmic adaptor subunit, partial [Cyclobacteriaceae bacterium]